MSEIDFDREVARVTEHADRAADQARERLAQVGRVTGKAESADGSISVEVSPGGLLAEIELSRSALRFGSDAIAQQILDLSDRATRRAGDKMYHTLAPVLGDSGAKHLQSLGFEPMPEDDEQHVTKLYER
jgi:hypothetical protein